MGKTQCLFIQQIFIEHLLYVPGPILGSGDTATNQSGKILSCLILESVSRSTVILDIGKWDEDSKAGWGE